MMDKDNKIIESLTDYLSAVFELNKTSRRTYYRGQADIEWDITSSAYREMKSPTRKKL